MSCGDAVSDQHDLTFTLSACCVVRLFPSHLSSLSAAAAPASAPANACAPTPGNTSPMTSPHRHRSTVPSTASTPTGAAAGGHPTTCPGCDSSCNKHRRCGRCTAAFAKLLKSGADLGSSASSLPCLSLGGCLECDCEPVCRNCGCRCSLCAKFGAGSACMTVGCSRCDCKPVCTDCGCACALCGNKGVLSACATIGCIACDCKPVCEWCGCVCGLCGNKGGLAACRTVGCANCSCSPPWVPWGRKFVLIEKASSGGATTAKAKTH